jgi:uncharacterized membrane protein
MLPMTISRNNLILFCLVIFGAVIRFWNFWTYPFHVDETFTLNLVSKPFLEVLAFGLSQDCNPPLYYIIDWFSVRIFGLNAFGERFPAVIFGILCIPAAYWFGKELRDDTLGFLSAAIVTTSGTMWFYSTFGRAYSMICFLFTCTLVYYVRILRGDTSRGTCLIFAGLGTVCIWTHLYALVPIGLMTMYIIHLHGADYIRKSFTAYLPVLGLSGVFYSILFSRQNHMQNWFGYTPAQLVGWLPLEYFGFNCWLFVPLIGISGWLNKQDKIIGNLLAIWAVTFLTQLAVCTFTPVFIRYSLLMVPMLLVISMEPVARFIRNEDSTKMQKGFILGVFGGMYLGITLYQFLSGAYDGRQL